MQEECWVQATLSLSEEDRRNFDVSRLDKLAILTDILRAVESKKKQCLKNRWKYRKNGREIIIRDQLEKVILWIDKFKAIGNAAVQYDPVHAALPWAGVLLVLQISVNDAEILGAMIDGIEHVSYLITRYTALENLYLRSQSDSPMKQTLRESIAKLYVSVLRYLLKAKIYFERRTLTRIMLASVTSAHRSVEMHLNIIEKKRAQVDSCIQVIDAERQEQSSHREKNLEKILIQLEKPIFRSAAQLSEIHDHLLSSERVVLLRWLSRIPYRKIHQKMGKNILPRTGEWLQRNQTFVNWLKSSESSILLLHGIPGCGKTKLMHSIVDFYSKASDAGSAMIAHFYCTRSSAEPALSDPEEILNSILKQLSSSSPDLAIRAPVVTEYQDRQEMARIDGDEVARLETGKCRTLIVELLKENPAYIFIDALDECDPSRREDLIYAIQSIVNESASIVKVLVSSREDHDICCVFADSYQIRIDAEDNKDDIERFIVASLSKSITEKRLLNGHVSQMLWDKITTTLVCGSEGMFRWASLQIELLCDRDRVRLEEDVIHELGSLPQGLKDSYGVTYKRIRALSAPSQNLAFRVIRWLMCSQSLLTADELVAAVSVNQARQNYTAANILDVCCNLVTLDDHSVFKFAHLSVQEYFESLDEFSTLENHAVILKRCLEVYTILNDASAEDTNVKNATILKAYAGMYWPMHYQVFETQSSVQDAEDTVLRFILGEKNANAAYQDWASDAWNFSIHSEALGPINTHHECTEAHRQKLGSSSSKNTSPVFLASSFGWPRMIGRILTLSTFELNCRNQRDESALYAAGKWGHVEVLTLLIAHHDSKGNDDIEEALFASVESLNVHTANFLIRNGANGYKSTRFGESALQVALRKDSERLIHALIETEPVDDIDSFAKACCFAHDEGKNEILDRLILKATLLPPNQHCRLLTWFFASEYDELTLCFLEQRLSAIAIENGVDFAKNFNAVMSDFAKAFNAVVSTEDIPLVERLWEFLETVKRIRVSKKLTEIHEFVGQNKLDAVALLLTLGAPIDGLDERGRTPLNLSIAKGHVDMALFLIDHGADINAIDRHGYKAIHHICSFNNPEFDKIIQALVLRGADLNSLVTVHRITLSCLSLAILSGDFSPIKSLLDLGADVDHIEASALHAAAATQSSGIVKLLLDRGANPNLQCPIPYPRNFIYGGCTAVHFAAMLGRTNILVQLLEALADVNAVTSTGISALHIAALKRQEHVVECLVKYGADIDARCSDDSPVPYIRASFGGMTALHIAVIMEGLEIVRRLIKVGADVNATDNAGSTSLDYAKHAVGCKSPIATALIEAGACTSTGHRDSLGPFSDLGGLSDLDSDSDSDSDVQVDKDIIFDWNGPYQISTEPSINEYSAPRDDYLYEPETPQF